MKTSGREIVATGTGEWHGETWFDVQGQEHEGRELLDDEATLEEFRACGEGKGKKQPEPKLHTWKGDGMLCAMPTMNRGAPHTCLAGQGREKHRTRKEESKEHASQRKQ